MSLPAAQTLGLMACALTASAITQTDTMAQSAPFRAKTKKGLDERQKALDAKMKRTIGGICNGC